MSCFVSGARSQDAKSQGHSGQGSQQQTLAGKYDRLTSTRRVCGTLTLTGLPWTAGTIVRSGDGEELVTDMEVAEHTVEACDGEVTAEFLFAPPPSEDDGEDDEGDEDACPDPDEAAAAAAAAAGISVT